MMSSQIIRPFPDGSLEDEIVSGPIVHISVNPKLLVVVDRQEFIRGCLNSWIRTFCREFELSSVADVTASLSATALAQAIMVIFHANNLTLADSWLDGQITWLRANRPDIPIVAIVEPDKTQSIAGLVARLRLKGCIPTSSSMEVAAAVLRLVAAGGTYIPQIPDDDPPPQPSPHYGLANSPLNSLACDTAMVNAAMSGASLCSGMFGISS